MVEDWARVSPTDYTRLINRPDRLFPMSLYASLTKDKMWHLRINTEYIASFQTFEELDGMVPVLVNGYLNRSDE